MSLAGRGRKKSAEHRRKIGLAHKGRVKSSLEINHLSESRVRQWKDPAIRKRLLAGLRKVHKGNKHGSDGRFVKRSK